MIGKLFESITIGSVTARNRIAFAPTGMGTAANRPLTGSFGAIQQGLVSPIAPRAAAEEGRGTGPRSSRCP